MSNPIDAVLSYLGTNHSHISLHTRDSPEYDALRKTYIITPKRPAIIARPGNFEDVQALVRACVDNGVDFTVRTGGHDTGGRTMVDNALTIDMRGIAHVEVSEDKKTAKVGGGVLVGGLLKALGEHGLVTPCGSMGSVGLVGWSTLGGYGPFASLHGLGLDQIVGAKLVTSKGDIIDAEEDLLKAIRGAGPTFGVIVELTVKLYELKELLTALLVFESSDMDSVWSSVTQGIESFSMPGELQVQPFVMDFPGAGKVLGTIITWVSDDHEEGRKWVDKVASLATCIMNTTEAKTPLKYAEDNEKLVPYGVHGRPYTISVRRLTPEVASVLAKYSAQIPAGNPMISVHSLRSPKENKASVFGARETHFMIEVVAMSVDPTFQSASSDWGRRLVQELREQDQSNILGSSYISLLVDEDVDPKKIFHEHLETVVGLKRKYDPENIFRNGPPKIVI